MMRVRFKTALLAVMSVSLPAGALAHHGWAWTEDEESRLSGEIVSISFGNPHMHLELRDQAGTWQVDLAPPSASARAGFVEGVAETGDQAVVTGHRSRDADERAFKAETITVNGKTYDVYPDRPKTLKPGK